MLPLGIAILIGLGLALFLTRSSKYEGSTAITLIIGIFTTAAFVGVIAMAVLPSFLPSQTTLQSRIELVSLRDNVSASGSGSSFLGSGSYVIASDNYLTYYYRDTDGGAKSATIPSKEAKIFEQDRMDAVAEHYLTGIDPVTAALWCPKDYRPESSYVLYVPRGTIGTQFALGDK